MENDYFGFTVSLLGDRALISAYSDNENGIDSGSAYLFDLEDNTWLLN